MLHILSCWQDEGIVILAILLGIVLFHYVHKLWNAPIDAMLALILGASATLAIVMMHFMHVPGFHFGTRAFWFVTLYLWCVLGMVFFAARHTHRAKLFIGLVSQAGIVYALFILL